MNYKEVKELPIRYRRWFIERLSKHFRMVNEKKGNASTDSPKPLNVSELNKFEDLVGKKLAQKSS